MTRPHTGEDWPESGQSDGRTTRWTQVVRPVSSQRTRTVRTGTWWAMYSHNDCQYFNSASEITKVKLFVCPCNLLQNWFGCGQSKKYFFQSFLNNDRRVFRALLLSLSVRARACVSLCEIEREGKKWKSDRETPGAIDRKGERMECGKR